MNIEVPEKTLDLIFDLYDLVEPQIQDRKNSNYGWFTTSFGVPKDGIICAVKCRGSDIINIARYNGQKSCWEYHTSMWFEIPELDTLIELWHPLPKFEKVEI